MADPCSQLLHHIIVEIAELKELVRTKIPDPGRLYNLKQIQELTGLAERTLRLGIADGRYVTFHNMAARFAWISSRFVRRCGRRERMAGGLNETKS